MIVGADYTFNTIDITLNREETDAVLRALLNQPVPPERQAMITELRGTLIDWLHDPRSIEGNV